MLSSLLHATGFRTQLQVDGEIILIGTVGVAAIVQREPRFYTMEDAGYLDKSPMIFEVLQGRIGSTATIWLNGTQGNLDCQGVTPQINRQVTIDGVVMKMVKVQNGQDRWIVTTIKLNTTANQQQQI